MSSAYSPKQAQHSSVLIIHLPHAHSSHSLPVPMSSVYSPKQAQHLSVLMLSSFNRGALSFGKLSAVGDVPSRSELAAIEVSADVHVLVGAAFPFMLAVAAFFAL